MPKDLTLAAISLLAFGKITYADRRLCQYCNRCDWIRETQTTKMMHNVGHLNFN